MALARPSPMQRHSTVFALLDSMDGASTLADNSEVIQWLRKCTDEYEFGATAGGKRLAAAILRRMNAHLITEEKKNVPSEEKSAASSVELIRQDWSSEEEKEEMANRLGNLALVTSTSSKRKAKSADSSWEAKYTRYKKEPWPLTRKLAESEQWDGSVRKQQQELLSLMDFVWGSEKA